jgi:hypothetical protein
VCLAAAKKNMRKGAGVLSDQGYIVAAVAVAVVMVVDGGIVKDQYLGLLVCCCCFLPTSIVHTLVVWRNILCAEV